MARAKRHHIPGEIWHTPFKYAYHVQSSIRGPQSGIPQGKHLTEVESKGFVKSVRPSFRALAKEKNPREGAAYGDHFGVKNEDVGVDNAYF